MSQGGKDVSMAQQFFSDEPCPMDQRSITTSGLGIDWFNIMIVSFIWFMSALCISIAGNFWLGFFAVIIGNIIGIFVMGAMGVPSWKYGLPALAIQRTALGRYGADVPGFLQGLMMIFFTWFQTVLGAIALNELTKFVWGFDNFILWALIIGIVSVVVVYFGYKGISLVEKITAPILLAVFVGFIIVVLAKYDIGASIATFNANGTSWYSWLAACELMFGGILTWTLMPGDYTRFGKKKSSASIGLPVGVFLGTLFMAFTGGLGLVATGQTDPGTAMIKLTEVGATPWAIIFIIGFVISTITTNFVTIYCSCVSWGTLKKKVATESSAKMLFWIIAIVSIIGGIWKGCMDLSTWVGYMESFLAPTVGVVMANFFFFEDKLNLSPKVFLNRTKEVMFKGGFNPAGFGTWVIGLVIFWILKFVLPAAVHAPTMITIVLVVIIYSVWAKSSNPLSMIPGVGGGQTTEAKTDTTIQG